MERKAVYSGWTVITGTLGFILIVTFLHIVQPNYNPLEQQMSELALGRFGSFMLLAFSSLSLSIFTLQLGLQKYQTPLIIRLFLVTATFCLLGAGFFRLDTSTDVHIAFVSIAFALIVLVMYLLPRNVAAFNDSVPKIVSWSLGAGTATFVALGQNLLPMGVGQRGAMLCISVWLIWVGRSLICKKYSA